MRIFLISRDRMLADALARTEIREEDTLSVFAESEAGVEKMTAEHADVVILSDRLTVPGTMSEFAEAVRSGNKAVQLVVLLSNRHHAGQNAQIMKECLSEGWLVVPPGLTVKQATERIGQLIYGERDKTRDLQSGIVQFVGTTPNIGTTVAAFGTAFHMAGMTDRKIAYLCLNLKSSKIHRYLGEREPAVSLDGLRAELKSGALTGGRLLRQSRIRKQKPNFFVLYGNMQREQADYYSVEEIECLLQAASDAFDYCLVETSAYWDNAGTIGTMLQAGQRIMVTTPQLSHFQEDLARWLHALSPVFGRRSSDFDLLVTQLDPEAPYRAKDIAKEANMSRIGEIRKAREIDLHLSAGRLWEAMEEEAALRSDLSRIAKTLLTLHGEAYRQPSPIKNAKSLFSGLPLFGRRAGLARK